MPKILRVMNTNASPTTVFETDEDRSYFLIRLPIHEGFVETEKTTQQVTPEVRRLLTTLHGEMGRSELMVVLGLKEEKHFREYYQQAAIQQGLIEMTVPDKPKSRLQKYRLTELGKQVLSMKNTK